MPRDTAPQLSFNVQPHPRAMVGDEPWLLGELTAKLAIPVREDLNPGDRLMVNIAGADGELIYSGYLEVESLAFPPLKLEGQTVGTTRLHKANLVDQED
jgi:hypothetical protein